MSITTMEGVIEHKKAISPEFVTFKSRLDTFKFWPVALKQKDFQLAEAGFLYLNKGDIVKCFCCDGSVNSWDPKDEPWIEHARWFPHCTFLLSTKGYNYVNKIQEDKKANLLYKNKKQDELLVHPVKENKTVQNNLLCQICCEQIIGMVYLPCGHVYSCPSCTTVLKSCPVCRKNIIHVIRVYFSSC